MAWKFHVEVDNAFIMTSYYRIYDVISYKPVILDNIIYAINGHPLVEGIESYAHLQKDVKC